MIDRVVDETVQIYGGYGFVEEYPAERAFRDARVNRIFEGTNEINRLLVPGTLIKRLTARKTSLDDAAKAAWHGSAPAATAAGAVKQIALGCLGEAALVLGANLEREQEVLMALTDLMIDAFAAESAELRAAQATASGHPLAPLHADACSVIIHEARTRAALTANTQLSSILEGDALRSRLSTVSRIFETVPSNTMVARRRIADAVVSKRGYPFGTRA
jgi:hypothetical protein